MPSLAQLKTAIDELNARFPRPSLPPLELSDVYDLREDWPRKKYPCSDSPGVYALIDETDEVAYVGKASFNHVIGNRLGARFCYGPDKAVMLTVPEWQSERIRYIAAIGLPAEHAFEAPAIEEFLIHRLQPRLNSVGRLA